MDSKVSLASGNCKKHGCSYHWRPLTDDAGHKRFSEVPVTLKTNSTLRSTSLPSENKISTSEGKEKAEYKDEQNSVVSKKSVITAESLFKPKGKRISRLKSIDECADDDMIHSLRELNKVAVSLDIVPRKPIQRVIRNNELTLLGYGAQQHTKQKPKVTNVISSIKTHRLAFKKKAKNPLYNKIRHEVKTITKNLKKHGKKQAHVNEQQKSKFLINHDSAYRTVNNEATNIRKVLEKKGRLTKEQTNGIDSHNSIPKIKKIKSFHSKKKEKQLLNNKGKRVNHEVISIGKVLKRKGYLTKEETNGIHSQDSIPKIRRIKSFDSNKKEKQFLNNKGKRVNHEVISIGKVLKRKGYLTKEETNGIYSQDSIPKIKRIKSFDSTKKKKQFLNNKGKQVHKAANMTKEQHLNPKRIDGKPQSDCVQGLQKAKILKHPYTGLKSSSEKLSTEPFQSIIRKTFPVKTLDNQNIKKMNVHKNNTSSLNYKSTENLHHTNSTIERTGKSWNEKHTKSMTNTRDQSLKDKSTGDDVIFLQLVIKERSIMLAHLSSSKCKIWYT